MASSSISDDVEVVMTPQSEPEKAGSPVESQSAEDSKAEDGKSKEEEEEKIVVGTVCDTKHLYQKFEKDDKFTWTAKAPEDLEEAAENEDTLKYAILVRNKKSYDSRKKLEIDSIVIQSPYLKRVLHGVLKDYPGVTTTLTRLIFTAPFKPFVHRWSAFTASLENEGHDAITASHLQLLHTVLYTELKDTISALDDYIKNSVVSYELVWTIFQPGCTVLAGRYGRAAAVRLVQGQYGEHCKLGPCFIIKSERVDWDGSKFGYDASQQLIMPFVGTVPIAELESYPLEFAPDADEIRSALLARGRQFEKLAGYHFKMYKGAAIEQKEMGPALTTVDSRIVIDAYTHGKAMPGEKRNLSSLKKAPKPAAGISSADSDAEDNVDDDSDSEYDYGFVKTIDRDLAFGKEHTRLPLTDEELVLCTPMLKGYALKSKKWLEFYVDCVGEIEFNAHAFDSLVLPAGHKQLILAFAQSQLRFRDQFDDVIAGKGKGIIMLLSGGPGIGKTLTAESVAETMGVPLYVMSAGELGSHAYDVERRLGEALEVVAKWGAVLLLDECDVFLEKRTSGDLSRNRIVSIFLRMLEYYEGILFLTTNRVNDMDEAFQSRIHISLEYPDLDEQARRKVWEGFLERSSVTAVAGKEGNAAGHIVTKKDIGKLAKLALNGRQIKNVLKTSSLLAWNLGQTLSYEHLKTVLRVEGRQIED